MYCTATSSDRVMLNKGAFDMLSPSSSDSSPKPPDPMKTVEPDKTLSPKP